MSSQAIMFSLMNMYTKAKKKEAFFLHSQLSPGKACIQEIEGTLNFVPLVAMKCIECHLHQKDFCNAGQYLFEAFRFCLAGTIRPAVDADQATIALGFNSQMIISNSVLILEAWLPPLNNITLRCTALLYRRPEVALFKILPSISFTYQKQTWISGYYGGKSCMWPCSRRPTVMVTWCESL